MQNVEQTSIMEHSVLRCACIRDSISQHTNNVIHTNSYNVTPKSGNLIIIIITITKPTTTRLFLNYEQTDIHGLPTVCLLRSTQPSTLCGMRNE